MSSSHITNLKQVLQRKKRQNWQSKGNS